ncbi:MAG: 50S ribosomal protein L20 [Parcubacteria group bacterium]|nr:50S ribosomal protein L20 [Parcubacteria group bacterium]
MTRVKRGIISLKRRRRVLKRAKGYRFGRSTKERMAKDALAHAGMHAFRHRRAKKREFRKLWNVKINAETRKNGTSYSRLIGGLKKRGVSLNRKMLAELAERHPEQFKKVVEMSRA